MGKLKNIVFITVDSLRADRLGCQGNVRGLTPNLDHLAAGSTRFSHAFSNGPNTPNAFPAIMSGRSALCSERLGLFDAPITLAEILSEAGYNTAGVNAANPYISRYFKYDRGFDRFDDFVDFRVPGPAKRGAAGGSFRSASPSSTSCISIPGLDLEKYLVSASSIQAKARLESELAGYTMAMLEELTEPFFLWLHLMDTHYPYLPQRDAQFALSSRPVSREENLALNTRVREHLDLSPVMLAKVRDLYDAAVLQMDQKVGAVMSWLQSHDLFDDAVFACTADHGEEFMDHGEMQHKSKLYDELLHVPLIIKKPRQVLGETRTDPVSLLRMPATLLQLAGVATARQQKSLFDDVPPRAVPANAACGADGGPPADSFMFHTDQVAKVYSCRTRSWKLIYKTQNRELELYNLLQDNRELRDVYTVERQQVAALERDLIENVRALEVARVQEQVGRLSRARPGVSVS